MTVTLLDGLRRLPDDTPVLRADDLGVLRGESVFETLRIAGGRPVHLEQHLARLAVSAARLALDLPSGWSALAHAAVDRDEGVLRLVCTRGGVGFALVTDIPTDVLHAREHGVHVVTLGLGITADQRATAPWLLGGVKSTSYAVNMASLRAAHDLGAEDAIWVSTDGWVLEAPTAAVVVALDGALISPPVAAGILPSLTLAAARELVDIASAPVSITDLARADEVMLLSSVRGVAPVVALDRRELGIGPRTAALRASYEASALCPVGAQPTLRTARAGPPRAAARPSRGPRRGR